MAKMVGSAHYGYDVGPEGPATATGGGSHAHAWAREAGFGVGRIEKGASVMAYGRDGEERSWHGGLHVERVDSSDVREKFRKAGASDEELATIVEDLRRWSEDEDGMFWCMICEIICRC